MIYLQLFFEFFKTGLFAIGGGLATLPFLQDISLRTGWFSAAELADMIAVSESTPGPIGINMATYVGFRTAGILGAVIATLAEILPSLIIVIAVAGALHKFSSNKWVKGALYGLRPASLSMVAAAGLSLVSLSLVNLPFDGGSVLSFFRWKEIALAAALCLAMTKLPKLHPVVWIGAAAVVGAAVL
jgi:chromate transporter